MGVLSNLFRKSAPADRQSESWWKRADQIALHPTAETIDELRAVLGSSMDPDEAECQAEMIDGLSRLLALDGQGLPRIDSQHRVIGGDACHFAAPAGLAGDQDTPGKALLTSRRIVFACGTAQAWPWHRVGDVTRIERDLLVTLRGGEIVRLRFNSYGDALEARWVAEALRGIGN